MSPAPSGAGWPHTVLAALLAAFSYGWGPDEVRTMLYALLAVVIVAGATQSR
ncbi:hypothetical protein [Streptomyces zagrosensis]|uniref:Metal-dependent phosphohydrolase n=1 Tax=Streptomyces zagrosensis TaxID=1042984 RepID=A0A7W9Q880_9ACTN|nr:hypothetical protein [Streptomyces zagrosensis]MBB5935396.1 hypothetical protein [Streptomyces zagrosensis]